MQGGGGYDDIIAGTEVVLKDGGGTTLAVGQLGPGGRKDDLTTFPKTFRCAFSFSLADVPEVPFYSFEVGRRGGVTYSIADLRAANWMVSLTLGR